MTAFLLHQLVTESALAMPDAAAVHHGDRSLTYGELDQLSDAVARGLVRGGIIPGDRVVLHVPKSLETIVALYGVLKAGACYVPVDVSNPAARLADIVEQCAARAVVTTASAFASLEQRLPSSVEWVVLIDRGSSAAEAPTRVSELRELTATSADVRLPTVVDQDLAYVLFTSGSTGRPKGVMLSHLNALTFINWGCERFGITAADRLSNHAPLNFDLSVFDLFVAAKAGASVTLVPEGLGAFPIRLADLIERNGLTVWYSVPSILRLLVDHGRLEQRDLSSMRLVLFAGEVFPVKHLRRLTRALPHPRYFNLYGPTETNVCTFYEVGEIPDEQTEPIPIGKACGNADALALDEDGQLVTEPGREGLLYVRGSAVMQGYYGSPAETEDAFVSNPFAPGRRDRLYCTQDWVSVDEEGNFLFLGRRDHMVKVGGYRVELGEIESALHTHDAVREAVAVALPDDTLGARIRAFVVAEGRDLTEPDVKRHCARLLPKYMVPHEVELRDALPRTVTDKVDRTRLREEALRAGALS